MVKKLLLVLFLLTSFVSANARFDTYITKKTEKIYKQRDFRPIWIKDFTIAQSVFYFIDYVDKHQDFFSADDLQKINYFKKFLDHADLGSSDAYANVDVTITKVFLKYAYILNFGGDRTNNYGIKGFDVSTKKEKDKYSVKGFSARQENKFFANAVQYFDNVEEVYPFINYLVPVDSRYVKLKEVKSRYEEIAQNGGFVKVAYGNKLKIGSRGKRVKSLYFRLLQTGDITERKNDAALLKFDNIVKKGVMHFQKRFNLREDGVIGKNTITLLNVPVKKRLREIDINLRRWHFLPRQFGENYILVNIPEYRLRLYRDSKQELAHNVIVGTHDHPTPVFSEDMKYIVVNPYWRVPESIILKEFVPKMQEDLGYLDGKNIAIYTNSALKGKTIDPYEIDWDSFDKYALRNSGYRFIQMSGDKNALGRIKFLFPNRHSVYLHDTPTKYLFKKKKRSYSHGCIRLQNPFKLAEYILNDKEGRGIVLSDIVVIVDLLTYNVIQSIKNVSKLKLVST